MLAKKTGGGLGNFGREIKMHLNESVSVTIDIFIFCSLRFSAKTVEALGSEYR